MCDCSPIVGKACSFECQKKLDWITNRYPGTVATRNGVQTTSGIATAVFAANQQPSRQLRQPQPQPQRFNYHPYDTDDTYVVDPIGNVWCMQTVVEPLPVFVPGVGVFGMFQQPLGLPCYQTFDAPFLY
jgi:hypothetical protein